MARDVTVYGDGGDLVADAPGGSGEHFGMPSRSDLERRAAFDALPGTEAPDLTDKEHFRAFESQLTSALAERGIRDELVAGQIANIAEGLYHAHGDDGDHPLSLLGLLAERLLRAGIDDPRVIGVAVSSAADYVSTLVGEALREGVEGGYADRDEEDFRRTREALVRAWGQGYRGAVKSVRDFVNSELPPSLADAIWDGRDADGRRLANSVDVLTWLANLAQGRIAGSPGGTRRGSPRGSGGPTDVVREIAEIEQTMRTDRRRYDRDEAMQARYRALIRVRDGLDEDEE